VNVVCAAADAAMSAHTTTRTATAEIAEIAGEIFLCEFCELRG
jgi:hypothetical protein